MKKNADNTPTFEDGQKVKVAQQEGRVERTLEDGRLVVRFDNGARQPIEPDKATKV
jgi:hypothetical protein